MFSCAAEWPLSLLYFYTVYISGLLLLMHENVVAGLDGTNLNYFILCWVALCKEIHYTFKLYVQCFSKCTVAFCMYCWVVTEPCCIHSLYDFKILTCKVAGAVKCGEVENIFLCKMQWNIINGIKVKCDIKWTIISELDLSTALE